MKINSKGTTLVLVNERCPKYILPQIKIIYKWNGKYHRAIETKDYIYFCNYQEGDDNASVIMYRKSDLSFICDNYHAMNDLINVILNKKYTYLSKSMKYNARQIQLQ